MLKIYGIPNCNTVKKALNFLQDQKLTYEFINFKKTPPSKEQLKRWKDFLGDWPINKRGTTYRKHKENFEKADEEQKWKLIIESNSMIKRPILEKNHHVLSIGFNEREYLEIKNNL